jgi:HemY protein
MALGGDAALARQWLADAWDGLMVSKLAASERLRVKYIAALEASLDSLDAAWLARIEAALQARPQDASLEYLAGMACLKRQLWGKAQQLLSHALLGLQDSGLKRRAWSALAELAEQRADSEAARRAYREAAKA